MKISGNKILITGGGSGIGYALTERFIRENNSVIICSRRESALKEAAKKFPSLITHNCDLAIEEQRVELYNWIEANHPDTNVLINNAGIQQWMTIENDDFMEKAKEEININVIAPIHLTKLFMKLRSLNTIINVTSGLSFVPLAKVPVYCGTKAFLHSFTLTLRKTLKQKNIEVIEMIPPALNTDLGGKGKHDFAPPLSGFINSVFTQLQQGSLKLTYGFSETASKAGPEQLNEAFERLNQPPEK